MGAVVPPDNYWPLLRGVCDKYGVLLIADEVITGFGRTGALFALDHWGVEPGIMQFAKAITSGYMPFGGIGISDRIAAALDADERVWMHAYTSSAHPTGCAVAARNLRIIRDEDLPGRCAVQGDRLLAGLRAALVDHPHVGEVRGKGLMCAVELVADPATKQPFLPGDKVGPRVHREAAERGLISRVKADTYVLAPAAVITDDQIDRTVDILAGAVRAVLG